MSCNSSSSHSSKNKHYTPMERKVFLQILDLFKHIVEIKKSDGTTIKEKEVAWQEICSKYNASALISQERTVQQLKKLWTNIKQNQREAITKERQSRMTTGGGLEEPEANIDPDVALIALHLMKTAPVLFTSNMTEKEINDKRDYIYEVISTNCNVDLLNNEDDPQNIGSDIDINISQETSTLQDNVEQFHKRPIDIVPDNEEWNDKNDKNNDKNRTSRVTKGKRKEKTELNAEENIRIERIKRIMQQEQHLANIKSEHEKTMADIKEEHLKECNYLEIQHLKEMHAEEIKIKKIKLKNIERQLQQKENIDPHI